MTEVGMDACASLIAGARDSCYFIVCRGVLPGSNVQSLRKHSTT